MGQTSKFVPQVSNGLLSKETVYRMQPLGQIPYGEAGDKELDPWDNVKLLLSSDEPI